MPNLAHSRKQDPKRGAKREKGIRDLLRGDPKKPYPLPGWQPLIAPRQLTIIDKGFTHIYRSRKMDFWSAFDILAVRAHSKLLAIQSSTITNFSHKKEQIEASVLWPLLSEGEPSFFRAQIWVWGHRIRDVGPDGITPIPPPKWHYRVYELLPTVSGDPKVEWRRVAACGSTGKPVAGWPRPDVLEPLPSPIPPESQLNDPLGLGDVVV